MTLGQKQLVWPLGRMWKKQSEAKSCEGDGASVRLSGPVREGEVWGQGQLPP